MTFKRLPVPSPFDKLRVTVEIVDTKPETEHEGQVPLPARTFGMLGAPDICPGFYSGTKVPGTRTDMETNPKGEPPGLLRQNLLQHRRVVTQQFSLH
jgi:hypothetical protein